MLAETPTTLDITPLPVESIARALAEMTDLCLIVRDADGQLLHAGRVAC